MTGSSFRRLWQPPGRYEDRSPDWGAKASLTAMVVLLLGPVGSGMFVWLRNTDEDVVDFG